MREVQPIETIAPRERGVRSSIARGAQRHRRLLARLHYDAEQLDDLLRDVRLNGEWIRERRHLRLAPPFARAVGHAKKDGCHTRLQYAVRVAGPPHRSAKHVVSAEY